MAEPQSNSPHLPGLDEYHLIELPFEQRVLHRELLPEGTAFGVFGSIALDVPAPAKMLLEFDGLTGPMRLAFTDLKRDDADLGEFRPTVLWVTLKKPGIHPCELVFLLSTTNPARVSRVFRVSDESASLPWPPLKPTMAARRKEDVPFKQRLGATGSGWRIRLDVSLEAVDQFAELCVTCNCPGDQVEMFMQEDAPPGARVITEPGDQPNDLAIFVEPSAISRNGLLLLVLKSENMLRVESVSRVY